MTKIKNTKKGMAKKTLSMSLVVAMLATSNVPVWAAEFSDGSDASVATEAPAAETATEFSDADIESPVVEDTADADVASTVNEGDVTTDLKATDKSIIWGESTTVTGTIVAKNNESLTGMQYCWKDENGIVATGTISQTTTSGGFTTTTKSEGTLTGTVSIGTDNKVNIPLDTNEKTAGKTLTLWIFSPNGSTTGNYNINTGITVSVEKRKLDSITVTATATYDGFDQSVDVSKCGEAVLAVKNANGQTEAVTNPTAPADPYYTLSSTSAKNAGEKMTVTATATPNSPYEGSVSTEVTIDKLTYDSSKGQIKADAADGLEYQYTGKEITIPTDKVTLKESKKEDDLPANKDKLGGNDLSSAIKKATVKANVAKPDVLGSGTVSIDIDTAKLKNFKGTLPAELSADTKVTIKQRDLSSNGTKITMKYADVPTNTTKADLVKNYLTFTGVDGSKLALKYNEAGGIADDYEVTIIEDSTTTAVDTLRATGTYTVTISAKKATGTCTGSQCFKVSAAQKVISGATFSNVNSRTYAPYYTGSEIKPSKAELGDLTVTFAGTDSDSLQSGEWEIVGYSNNINANVYDEEGTDSNHLVGAVGTPVKSQATVNIKLTGKSYSGQVISVPFNILPLKVTEADIQVPSTISYNKGYKDAGDYKVPVTVVAKAPNGKNTKTLDAKDFTVKYAYESGKNNAFDTEIVTKVTVTNTNYILDSADATKSAEITATAKTKIVAKALTDSMVVANPATYTYTGGKITPTYYVMDGQTVLYKEGEVETGAEYREVSITDAVNVGTGKITVEGIPNSGTQSGYSGKATGTFTITPANTSDVKVEFTNSDKECKYTGKQVRPRSIKVTLNGNNVTDQFEIVSYGENISGKGTVVLKPVDGNKNFTGSNVTAEFNIVKEEVKADLTAYDAKGFVISNPEFEYDGTAHTFAKVLLSNIKKTNGNKTTAKESDFEIKYVDNIAGKQTSDSSYNVGYVYAVAKDGTGFSGAQTLTTADGTIIKGVVASVEFKIKNVKFVAKNVTVKNGTYAAGLPVKPEVLIQIGGTTLVEGKDYKLTLVDKNDTSKEVTPTDVTTANVYGVKIEGINGYTGSKVVTKLGATNGSEKLVWGVDKKNLKDCTVTVKDGVTTVLNGYIPVASTEYTAKNNGDGTYTVTAVSTSKNYTGSVTVKANGKAEDEKPAAPMISSVKVVGNQATAILSGDSEGAAGYDYVISTDRDCIKNKDYASVNKNQVSTSTTFKYVQQGTYYAYCHAWKRDENGKKVFSDWSNAYPFVVSAITPDAPVITNVKVSGSTIKVTYKAAANATGYDVVLGTGSKKENGETRPYQYGNHKKLNLKEGTVTATFKNVPKGTWVVGMHAFNRTSEDGKKVFSPWSNLKKATVK